MANYRRQNDKTIRRAFAGITAGLSGRIENAMVELLKSAVIYALQNHDDDHQMHILMGDTYGWILLHDGVEVRREVTAHHSSEAFSANLLLSNAIPELPKTGWIGVVMAGMQPAKWFAVQYEQDILIDTAKVTRNRALSLFKKIIPRV